MDSLRDIYGDLSPYVGLSAIAVSFPMILSIFLSKRDPKHLGMLTHLKIFTAIQLSVMFFMDVTKNWNITSEMKPNVTEIISNLFMSTLCGGAAAVTIRQKRTTSNWKSFCLMTFWIVMLLSTFRDLYINFIPDIYSINNTGVLMYISRFFGVSLVFIFLLFSKNQSMKVNGSLPKNVHPQESASLWGDFTLNWTFPLLWTGYRRHLKESDVPDLSINDRCCNVVPPFERAWKQEEYRCKLINESQTTLKQSIQVDKNTNTALLNETHNNEDTPVERCSLIKVIFKTHGFQYLLQQFAKIMLEMHSFLDPLLSASLMNEIQNKQNDSVWRGFMIVTSMFVLKCLTEAAHHRIWLSMCKLSRHISGGIVTTIFKKSLTLQNGCMKDKTKGEIVNLISADCEKMVHMGQMAFFIGSEPIKICLGMYILYCYLGSSMLAGVAIVLVLVPLNIYLGRRSSKSVIERSKVKDRRVKLMNEIINGIKVIKLYAWEKSFINKVNSIRSEEMHYNYRRCFDHANIDGMFRAIPFLVSALTFGIFVKQGGHLDATTGFITISLFRLLSDPLNHLVLFMPGYMDALASLGHITEFLNGKDISPDVVNRFSEGASAIRIKDGNFSWDNKDYKPTLRDINVNIPKGSLVAVVGIVGSGKSSLLSSMLGEMEKLDGRVEVQGRVAYVPQEAWILNATLQENILYGSKLDNKRYNDTIENCCLKNDIEIMPAGDKTEIGEKGVNLSGGQKQRTSIARAVYNNADVYLLDDPLSAVDTHVGKHIFNKVISHQGTLKGKTRILVTHGIHWLSKVDSIIVMKDGQVSEKGTYKELISRNGAFAQFLREVCSKTFTDEDEKTKILKRNIFSQLSSVEWQQSVESGIWEEGLQDDILREAFADDKESDEDDNILHHDKNSDISSGNCIDDEELEQGTVKKVIYLEFIKAVGLRYVFVCICIFCVSVIAGTCSQFIISRWSEDPLLANTSHCRSQEYLDKSYYYFYAYVCSGVIYVITSFLFIVITMKGGYKAASRIHTNLLVAIMRCPMSFFDTTPLGRIVTRFSSDVPDVDSLGIHFKNVIERVINAFACLILIIIYIPSIIVYLIPIAGLYRFLYCVHINSTRQLRRYTSKYKSPICVHFSETLGGVSSIRAYNSGRKFIKTMESKFDDWCKYDLTEKSVGLWVSVRLVFLYLLVNCVAGLFVVFDNNMSSGTAALVLIFAGDFSGSLGSLVHVMTAMETEIVSLERVFKYMSQPSEAPWDNHEAKPSAEWPSDGHVLLDNLKARYREGLDLTLKGINCDINKGEKIGIVGRTGAGKSSLTMALFRLIEADDGCIKVDNERIADMGLHDLRSKITILPQEPIIFAGTLRMNLDPFDKCTTKDLWKALEHSHLKYFVEGLPNQLDFECEEGGKNLSVGQRQLLCLARTLLRQTRILVLDEATAAVDMETDELIQSTIRSEFRECTVLAIAHRLNTIMDYDRILVLDQGLVKEFDSPKKLLANKKSSFYGMAKDAKLVK